MLLAVNPEHFFSGLHRLIYRLGVPSLVIGAVIVVNYQISRESLPQAKVNAGIARFFTAFIGRPLSKEEKREAGREFVDYFGAGQCDTPCASALTQHLEHIQVFQDQHGDPGDLILRQVYLAQSTFAKRPVGPTIMRLLNEPDPVAIVNPASARLMTLKDVAAVKDLIIFSRGAESPSRHRFSAGELARWKARLEDAFGSHAMSMPVMLTLAAEFRAGLEREWPRLSDRERQHVRTYLQRGKTDTLQEVLLARLLSIPVSQALKIQQAEVSDNRMGDYYVNLNRPTAHVFDSMRLWSVLQQIGQTAY